MTFNNELLAEKIATIFQNGIQIDKKGVHFIDTTFASSSGSEFSQIFSNPDSADAQMLYELLLFPDECIQMQVEPDLEKNQYSPEDMDEITLILIQNQVYTHISFPDNRENLNIKIPENALRQFVNRLNISTSLSESIAQTLMRCVADQTDYLRTRVRFRNRRFEVTDPIEIFLCELIEKIYPEPNHFWDALNFMLEFFNANNSIKNIYPALIEKKQDCIRLLGIAEKTEKSLRENAVESLMMKRTHLPPVHFEEVRKKLYLID